MQFVNPKPLLRRAREQGHAVPALNTNGGTYDITRAALEAAQELRAPVILQVYQPNCEYRGVPYFVRQAAWLADELGISVPVALQLDHGKSVAFVKQGVAAGLTAVMIDASHEPLALNVAQTRDVVAFAHTRDVAVEAEVGYVAGNEPKLEQQIGRVPIPDAPTIPPVRTNVDEAADFCRQVDVDMLAVAVGSTHGVYKCQKDLDFALLERLRDAVPVPLVMHGTGGIAVEDLTRLARGGMAKINFGEPFRYNYINYFNELTDEMEHLWHAWRIMREVKDRLKDDMQELIRALGADGKAD